MNTQHERPPDRGRAYSRILANELKGAILARGYKIKTVATQIGIDNTSLSRYFAGMRTMPVDVLIDACEIIGVSPQTLASRAYERLIEELGPANNTSN